MTALAPSKSARTEIALAIAQALLDGFNKHYRLFREIEPRGEGALRGGDWHAVRQAHAERIQFYDERVAETVERLQREFDTDALPDALWQEIKLQYVGLLTNHKQPELAETFFNSVSCRILHRTYYHNDFMFVRPAVSTEYIESDPPAYRSYYPLQDGLRCVLQQIFARLRSEAPLRAISARSALRAARGAQALPRPLRLEANHQIQVLSSLFFRNKRTYLIGKIINGNLELPFAVPIVHDDDGRRLVPRCHACSMRARSLSCSRSAAPTSWWTWKCRRRTWSSSPACCRASRKAELYTSLGLQKHGKTLFYRDFLHHLKHSTDAFVDRARHPRPGDDRVHAAVLSVRIQGDPRQHLADQEHRPADGQGQVPAGEAPRPGRTHGRHARVHGRGLPALALRLRS